MSARSFFRAGRQITIGDIASLTGAELRRNPDPARTIAGIATLALGGPSDLVVLDQARLAGDARSTAAAACLTNGRLAEHVPPHVALLIAEKPFDAFVTVARALYPDALRPSSLFDAERAAGVAPGAVMHPSARLESGVTIDPGAVIGAGVEIGAGTVIAANAVIGAGVRIGRGCSIGPNVSIAHALLGDRVTVHAGCVIGQDGFGFAIDMEPRRKLPQVGRVIIQDDVEIGAGTSIDRGGLRDTIIGEGTKIDNQVRVGHNAVIGRHCVLVAQVGIAGDVELEDYVVLGGQVSVADRLTIGEGARVAAQSGIVSDVPAAMSRTRHKARPGAKSQALKRQALKRPASKPQGKRGAVR